MARIGSKLSGSDARDGIGLPAFVSAAAGPGTQAIIRYTEYIDGTLNAVYNPNRSQAANGVPITDPDHSYTLFANRETQDATFALADETARERFDLGFLSRTQAAILADFSGQNAPVSLIGGTLGDVLVGGAGEDALFGVDGDDVLIGGGGNDQLDGGGGDDVLEGGAGADASDGGGGVNTVSFERSSAGVRLILANGDGDSGDAAGDTYVNIQNVRGSASNDRIFGDDFANVIEGGAGADALGGYDGLDTASYAKSAEGVTIDLRGHDGIGASAYGYGGDATGDDLLSFENVDGSALDDVLIGNSRALGNNSVNNVLAGAAGDDVLEGMGGADTLDGGEGRDIASYEHATAGVVASLADPSLNTGDAAGDVYLGIEDLRGSTSADTLTGDANNNVIQPGGIDADTAGPRDRVDGGAGRDTISYDGYGLGVTINIRDAYVSGNTVAGPLATFTGIENARGTAFADQIFGDAGNNVIEGGAGADDLDGAAGIDTLSYRHSAAGVQIDLVLGRSGSGSGDDARDVFDGFENLIGSDFRDRLDGDNADNRIEGGAGADEIDGLGGFDIAAYNTSLAAVTIDLAAATASGGDAEGDTLIGIEGLIGSDFADTLTGDQASNYFRGGTGDTISGLGGRDRIVLEDTRGAAIDGGTGADLLVVRGTVGTFASLTEVERVAVRPGGSLSLAGVGEDGPSVIVSRGVVGRSVTIIGSSGDERIVAGQFDVIEGQGGDDTIVVTSRQSLVDGGAGDDTLLVTTNAVVDLDSGNFANIETVVASDGAFVNMTDVVEGEGVTARLRSGANGVAFFGTGGDDQVFGGRADDTIAGGIGADDVRGGAGADLFVFRGLDEIATGGARDRILDFVSGTDRIDLSGIDADGDASNGDTAFAFVGEGAFTGTAGEIRIEQGRGVSFVRIDTDGDAEADLTFVVRGDASVVSDFLL